MRRRYWPLALALFSVIVFGSYLIYTTLLVRRIRAEARIHTEMYAAVQKGLFSPEEDASLNALIGLQASLKRLGVPIVVSDANNNPTAAENLPFSPDFNSTHGVNEIKRYARRLSRTNPPIDVPNVGTLYFGPPPLMRGLSWIPWLQTGGAILLVIIALAIIRASLREERERLWASMARELAHQMGTPLSSLSGWIEVLQLPADERDAMTTSEHIADVIQSDVERLERVSRRFELIGRPPVLQETELEKIVVELERYFGPRLPRLARGVKLRTRVSESLPRIEANHVLLVWALENIVKNAIDALAGRGGKISIVAYPAHDWGLHVLIGDDGPGIAPAVRDRIFDAGVTTKSAGWGVGLSLTQRIIEDLHGGKIVVRGRKTGGTVFDIHLPAAGSGEIKRKGVFKI
ncbi:MAG TPA: HAMP domain-containing sensor histidine kinase [Longimicrobiales bacterium]|nr:HAMP domain-containing sensor histidine kinase [Longimicrobiales bacterium]